MKRMTMLLLSLVFLFLSCTTMPGIVTGPEDVNPATVQQEAEPEYVFETMEDAVAEAVINVEFREEFIQGLKDIQAEVAMKYNQGLMTYEDAEGWYNWAQHWLDVLNDALYPGDSS